MAVVVFLKLCVNHNGGLGGKVRERASVGISSDQSMSVPPDTLLHSHNAHNDGGTSFIPIPDNS